MAPMFSLPIYLLTTFLILKNKSKMVRSVRKQYLRQILINFIFIVLLSLVVCPVLIPPIPGFYMLGLLATYNINVVLPMVLMTYTVILVAIAILQLIEHQLITLSDLRFTKKFDITVKLIRKLFRICYFFMMTAALAILPALTLEFELEEYRIEAFKYFHNPLVLCPNMFIADPRHWKIIIPYLASSSLATCCAITGVVSITTCLLMIFESRKIVSKDTLNMQKNFTVVLIYQAVVYITFIIVPVGILSAIFYADIPLAENGLYLLLLVSSQGAVNNLMHIVPFVWKLFRPHKHTNRSLNDQTFRSTSVSVVVT